MQISGANKEGPKSHDQLRRIATSQSAGNVSLALAAREGRQERDDEKSAPPSISRFPLRIRKERRLSPPPLPLISPDADDADGGGKGGGGGGSPNQITGEILKEKERRCAARTANDTSLPPPCIGGEGGREGERERGRAECLA